MNFELSRRKFLETGVFSALGLAGCLSNGDGSVEYPNSTTTDVENTPTQTTSTRTQTPTETTTQPTTTTPEQTATPTPTTSSLKERTATILSELDWFASSYRTAMLTYKAHVNRLYDTARYLRRRPSLSENDLRRLQASANQVVTFVSETLSPHFRDTSDIVREIQQHVEIIVRFANRGDLDRVESELGSLIVYCNVLWRDAFIDENFSHRPIYQPFFDHLTSELYVDTTPLVFIIGEPTEEYVTTVRPRTEWQYRPNPAPPNRDWMERRYLSEQETIFGGVDVRTGRIKRGYIATNARFLPDPPDGSVPARLFYLQQYSDTQSAQRALETLLSGPVVQESTAELGGSQWRQIYYYQELEPLDRDSGFIKYEEDVGPYFDFNGDIIREGDTINELYQGNEARVDIRGDIIYAYLKRLGPYLVTISPSTTAWEERPPITNRLLARTWLWEG